jgi:hypothetical protein
MDTSGEKGALHPEIVRSFMYQLLKVRFMPHPNSCSSLIAFALGNRLLPRQPSPPPRSETPKPPHQQTRRTQDRRFRSCSSVRRTRQHVQQRSRYAVVQASRCVVGFEDVQHEYRYLERRVHVSRWLLFAMNEGADALAVLPR